MHLILHLLFAVHLLTGQTKLVVTSTATNFNPARTGTGTQGTHPGIMTATPMEYARNGDTASMSLAIGGAGGGGSFGYVSQ